jgi:uncharacterized membrane-anchored protein YhcB (DUF1043 family)
MSHLGNEAAERIGAVLNRITRPGLRRRGEILILSEKIDSLDERVSSTQQALDKFARAIEVYATHLASHTSAIQELSHSAAELRESSAEQNRVLARITESLFTQKPRTEPRYFTEHPVRDDMVSAFRFINELEKRTAEARNLKYNIQGLFTQDILERTAAAQEATTRLKTLAGSSYIEGCSIKRPLNYRELHGSGLN